MRRRSLRRRWRFRRRETASRAEARAARPDRPGDHAGHAGGAVPPAMLRLDSRDDQAGAATEQGTPLTIRRALNLLGTTFAAFWPWAARTDVVWG
jgi:hypothetical protein